MLWVVSEFSECAIESLPLASKLASTITAPMERLFFETRYDIIFVSWFVSVSCKSQCVLSQEPVGCKSRLLVRSALYCGVIPNFVFKISPKIFRGTKLGCIKNSKERWKAYAACASSVCVFV
jgi:hypothetical protein